MKFYKLIMANNKKYMLKTEEDLEDTWLIITEHTLIKVRDWNTGYVVGVNTDFIVSIEELNKKQ